MANFTGAQRSNYVMFKPEKLEQVREYLEQFNVELSPDSNQPEFYCLLPSNDCEDIFSTSRIDEDVQLDLGRVAQQMLEGQVLVVMLAGYEKLRYIVGCAEAWNWKGESVYLDLSDIYKKAAEAFQVNQDSITDCSY